MMVRELAAGVARDSEIDNLDGVVVHHKNVAGLDVAVHQSLLVRRVQAPAGLPDDSENARNGHGRAAVLDERVESRAGQQRHHEERFLHGALRELADVVDADDIRMDHRREEAPFLVEKLDGLQVVELENRLQGHVPLHERVVSFVDDAHAAAPQDFPKLVTFLQTGPFRTHDV